MTKGTWKVFLGDEGLTDLGLYVGVITQFSPPQGALTCRIVAVLAEDTHAASTIVAMKYPEWELQALTNLTAFPWFEFVTLDSNCPQAPIIRAFLIEHVEAVPED